MLPLTVYNPTFHVHLYLFQNQQLRFFIPVFPPLITFPHENFIPLPVFSNLKLKCAYSFKAATSRAIWQCLHTISGHNFGFLSHPKNTVLIFVTTAPSNVKIISLKKKNHLSANADGSSWMPAILSTAMNIYCCCPLLVKAEAAGCVKEYFPNSAILYTQ